MKKMLAAAALAIASFSQSYGFILSGETNNSLVVTNATFYGQEGDINRKFKGYIGSQTGVQLINVVGNHRVSFTNVIVTFGSITNNTWSPGTDSANSYYVMVNFSSAAYPQTLSSVSSYYALWRLGIMPNDESTTNYLYGDGGYFTGDQVHYGAVNHYLLIDGDEKIAFEVQNLSTNTWVDYVNVDINVVGEYE